MSEKLKTALHLLDTKESLFIHIDASKMRSGLPQNFLGRDQVVLQIGYNLPVHIPDLALANLGFSCTLSFNGIPFFVQVWWQDVFALVGDDGRGVVYEERIPASIAAQLEKQVEEAKKPAKIKDTKVPYLKVVQ